MEVLVQRLEFGGFVSVAKCRDGGLRFRCELEKGDKYNYTMSKTEIPKEQNLLIQLSGMVPKCACYHLHDSSNVKLTWQDKSNVFTITLPSIYNCEDGDPDPDDYEKVEQHRQETITARLQSIQFCFQMNKKFGGKHTPGWLRDYLFV